MLANHTTVALTRRDLLLGAMITGAALVSGCSGNAESGSSAGSHAGDGGAGTVNVGTMVTEDFLPGWAAERDGLFGTDAQVNIITFQSAQELAAAMTSGDIDLAMTDPQVSAVLTAGGTPVHLAWITLGATPDQGRFGIQVGPDSKIASVEQLAGASIGVGSNTAQHLGHRRRDAREHGGGERNEGHGARQVPGGRLGQALAGNDTQVGDVVLEQDEHDGGKRHHPEQGVTEGGTGGHVGRPIARIDESHRYEQARADGLQDLQASPVARVDVAPHDLGEALANLMHGVPSFLELPSHGPRAYTCRAPAQNDTRAKPYCGLYWQR